MRTAADQVIEKCGGVKRVAEWLDLELSTVYRFTYPRSQGGTDGVIPARHQPVLLQKARENAVDLRPEDFFVMPDGSSDPEPARCN